MPVSGSLQAAINVRQTATLAAPDLGTVQPAAHDLLETLVATLTSGTGANQVDLLYSDTATLAASANTDIDLSGALANAVGGTSVFVKVRALIISAATGNTNNVVIGAAATNPWATFLNGTGTMTLPPGGFSANSAGTTVAGWAVTAGTGDLLRIANSGAGTSVTYSIRILGTSA